MIHVTRGNASHAELVIYIHLNPVRAGLVEDSAKHVFSGHRELLGKVRNPLLDVDDALLAFDTTTKSAFRTYLRRLNTALAAEKRTEVSERQPWWKPESELSPVPGRAYVDKLGRSTGRERRPLGGGEFVRLVCADDLARIRILIPHSSAGNVWCNSISAT